MAMTTATSPTYDYHAELDRITKELETTLQTKFENAIAQLNAKFNQRLDQLNQKFEQYFRQMEPLTKNYAALQTMKDNHAHDFSQMTKIVANLNKKFDAILERIPDTQTVANSLMLLRSVGQS